jgi:outer membrane protein
MKKIILPLLVMALSYSYNFAQTDTVETTKMSLQECIDYALKNNINLKNADLDAQIANAKIGEIRAVGLPQVSGSLGIQHNLKLRDSYFAIDSASPITNSFTKIDKSSQGKLIKFDNIFQLPDALDASITISQLIFSGSYIVGLQAAKAYKELSQKTTQQTKIQTAGNVTKAYYLALINLERINLFNNNILRVDSTLRQTKALQKQGFVESIDVDRLEVTLNNLVTEREKFVNLVLVSNVALKYQMGMPLDKNVLLTDSLKGLKIDESAISSEKVNPRNRIEFQQLQTSKKLQLLDLKNNRWSYLPSIQASANFGTFTQNKSLGGLFTGDNFYTLPGKEKSTWANYGIIQVGMNVPIFDGFSKKYKIQQSKMNLSKIEFNIKNLESTIQFQTTQSEIMLKNAIKSLQNQQRNMKLAENVSIISEKKYKKGVGSNLEIISAESDLKEAQINYYNALFDAITSKVDYDLAVGNIKY